MADSGRSPSGRATHEPSPKGLGHSVSVPNAARLLGLATLCEDEEGPDARLDEAIWLAAVADEPSRKAYSEGLKISQKEASFRASYMMDGARYTGSIDAAKTLLAPGTLWAVGSMEDGPFARLCWPQPDGGFTGGYFEAEAETAPLAMCAAALKARAASGMETRQGQDPEEGLGAEHDSPPGRPKSASQKEAE